MSPRPWQAGCSYGAAEPAGKVTGRRWVPSPLGKMSSSGLATPQTGWQVHAANGNPQQCSASLAGAGHLAAPMAIRLHLTTNQSPSHAARQPVIVCPDPVPETHPTYQRATSAADVPTASVIPSAARVSATQPGLTTLIRNPRGSSAAALRTKPSRPALTSAPREPPANGAATFPRERDRPVVPQVAQRVPGQRDLAQELAAQPVRELLVAGGSQVQQRPTRRTAHHGVDLTHRVEQRLDRRGVLQVNVHRPPAATPGRPRARPAVSSAAATALPTVPLAPTTMIFTPPFSRRAQHRFRPRRSPAPSRARRGPAAATAAGRPWPGPPPWGA